MTRKKLKKLMEQQWQQPGVARPLRPASWQVEGSRLAPNDDLDVTDPDDGGPFDP